MRLLNSALCSLLLNPTHYGLNKSYTNYFIAAFNFAAYWLSESWGTSAWSVGSAMVAGGLNWWHAFLAMVVGHFLASLLTTWNGRGGSMYHIGVSPKILLPISMISLTQRRSSFLFLCDRRLVCGVRCFQSSSEPYSTWCGREFNRISGGSILILPFNASSDTTGRIFPIIYPQALPHPQGQWRHTLYSGSSNSWSASFDRIK